MNILSYNQNMTDRNGFSKSTRIILGSSIILLALLLLVGGWSIPFKFQSFSILYKFGTEKTLLRAGKLVGITLVLLVFFQLLLAARFYYFEYIFSVKTELQLHRKNGLLIALLAIAHPVLIKASENFTPYRFEPKYYPEFVGIGLLCVILLVSITAHFRTLLKMSYPWWLKLHRIGATLVLAIVPAHILWVSDTFKQGLPRNAAIVIFSLNFLLAARIWLKRFSTAKK